MAALYLLFSHDLTEQQKKEAYEKLEVVKIHYLPDNLKLLWSQIPPEASVIAEYIRPIKNWLEERVKEGDYIVIQGDFGATYQMVKWAFSKGLKPIYATTKRQVVESRNKEEVIIKRVFQHVRFRLYEED
ncbi:MAG TPA: hypothetical protein GXX38_03290 [Clostridia bacterium]|nr:hypothetical protein [Clostridia bacterium]